jgi:cell division protein FtsI/penicillin-binding protein 2
VQLFGLDWSDDKPAAEGLSANDATTVLGTQRPATLTTMVRAYCMLANHGRTLASPPEPVVTEKTAEAVVRMLVAAVDHGTGEKAGLPGVTVAGKTGTVSRSDAKAGANGLLGLFAGFAPAAAPRLVAFVIIEGGAPGAGGTTAAPTFREVMGKSLAALDAAR